ncbi:MAG: hypothetical protein ABF729_10320, partial [Liquorilactobacillus nagelii]|uniref:hypothetical protein n=2 Tax=Liquorilactobacillus nagelii TaxID=82688 RepID=UPI001F292916
MVLYSLLLKATYVDFHNINDRLLRKLLVDFKVKVSIIKYRVTNNLCRPLKTEQSFDKANVQGLA